MIEAELAFLASLRHAVTAGRTDKALRAIESRIALCNHALVAPHLHMAPQAHAEVRP